MEYIIIKRISRRAALTVLLLFSAVANYAQGLPLIRNYTANEYRAHNCNFDIEIGKDGTVYVANFAGLLYYDRAQWRILYTPGINRVTVVFRASNDTVWVGGYNFIGRLEETPNGKLTIRQIGKTGQFKGEVMEIFEEEGRLQFVAGETASTR